MSNLSDKAREIKSAGEAERGNFSRPAHRCDSTTTG